MSEKKTNYHSEKSRKYRREAYEEGIKGERYLRMMVNRIRARSKMKGISCEITWKDIVIPKTCPVLGIEIRLGDGIYNSPSIDRFDNSIGYTKENIKIISWRANSLKKDATFEQIESLYNWMKKELGKE